MRSPRRPIPPALFTGLVALAALTSAGLSPASAGAERRCAQWNITRPPSAYTFAVYQGSYSIGFYWEQAPNGVLHGPVRRYHHGGPIFNAMRGRVTGRVDSRGAFGEILPRASIGFRIDWEGGARGQYVATINPSGTITGGQTWDLARPSTKVAWKANPSTARCERWVD